ncbi:Similar to Glucose dehydrogenase [acceptor]; acc. no. P18172 [Pyronema omphalodes CBS 100304]|uniref:Similar to Glucose dehydrogenase [acceptor] acc. no. P18172 n=1 Tax=Pyronema omphalodes (strain CBS 100304) TaxID=1076935 RepID=U4LMN1_PYROM|nr:Similar to Glucose dehydrogenase [acceptor]; acc. no. P18172 [Pyronema omphalodes CBS 100304]
MKMLSSKITLIALCTAHLAFAALALASEATVIKRADQLRSRYDYIIVGGGTSGLVVANRLTEDSSTTVLVLEAGEFDDGSDEFIVPGYMGKTLGSSFDWQVPSVPGEVLTSSDIKIPLGKVVGGSSALNFMIFDRGAPADYNAWESLGNIGWNWSNLLSYFKKSETFTPPLTSQVTDFDMTYDSSSHGASGPIHASFPPLIYPQTKNFVQGMNSLGIPTSHDQATSAIGVYYHASSIDPLTITRSFAKTAYHDPASKRSNYHLLPSSHVTKILLTRSSTPRAYSVSYRHLNRDIVVLARKEVILAAGAVHTPQILQLTGIGPSTLLRNLKIPLTVDLPGVGENFQDHPSVQIPYTFKNVFTPDSWSFNDILIATSGNALSFLPTSWYSPNTSSIIAAGRGQEGTWLSPLTAPEVTAGFMKQRELLLSLWDSEDAATMEVATFSMTQFQGPSLVISLQHPLSRGRIMVTSKDPYASPAVDFRAFTNPLDMELMIDGFLFMRKFLQTSSMMELQPEEALEIRGLETREEIRQWLRSNARPSFSHVCCTASMGQREEGGVVDSELKVWGTKGLRIVDASVMPLVPSAHLQATVYAVAERAADLIKGIL